MLFVNIDHQKDVYLSCSGTNKTYGYENAGITMADVDEPSKLEYVDIQFDRSISNETLFDTENAISFEPVSGLVSSGTPPLIYNVTVVNSTGCGIILYNNNTQVSINSSKISHSEGHGIVVNTNIGSANITDTEVFGSLRDDIVLDSNYSPVFISSSKVSHNKGHGMVIKTHLGLVNITDTEVSCNLQDGLVLHNDYSPVAISSSKVSQSKGYGMVITTLHGSVNITNTEVSGNLQDGIVLNSNYSPISISLSRISNCKGHGIVIKAYHGPTNVTDAEVLSNLLDGIVLDNDFSPVVISSTKVSQSKRHGMVIKTYHGSANITDTQVSSNALHGVVLNVDYSPVALSSSKISHSKGHGVVINTYLGSASISETEVSDNRGDGILFHYTHGEADYQFCEGTDIVNVSTERPLLVRMDTSSYNIRINRNRECRQVGISCIFSIYKIFDSRECCWEKSSEFFRIKYHFSCLLWCRLQINIRLHILTVTVSIKMGMFYCKWIILFNVFVNRSKVLSLEVY